MSKQTKNPETVKLLDTIESNEPQIGRNKLETQHEVTFAPGQIGSIDTGKPDYEGRRARQQATNFSPIKDYREQVDSPMKSVRFGKNSQESIATTLNSMEMEIASHSVRSVAGENEEVEQNVFGVRQRPRPIHDQKLMVANAMQALKSIKHVRQKKHVPNAIDDGNRFQGWNYVYDIIGLQEDARFEQLMDIKTKKAEELQVRKQSELMNKSKQPTRGDVSKKTKRSAKKMSTMQLGDQSYATSGVTSHVSIKDFAKVNMENPIKNSTQRLSSNNSPATWEKKERAESKTVKVGSQQIQKQIVIVKETPPKSPGDLQITLERQQQQKRLKSLQEEQQNHQRMVQYYKKSPRWNKINQLDGEIKSIAKSNEKWNDYMNKLKNAILVEQDSDEDFKVHQPNKQELLEKMRIKERIAKRQQLLEEKQTIPQPLTFGHMKSKTDLGSITFIKMDQEQSPRSARKQFEYKNIWELSRNNITMRIQDIDNKLQDFETKKQLDQESRRNFASLSSTIVKNAITYPIVTETSLVEANDYIGNLKLNLNQESSADPFGSIDHSALLDKQSIAKTSTAPFNSNDNRRTQSIKRKLDEFVLVSNMYDKKIDYKTFAKSLLQKKEKSSFGLVDPYDTIVTKAAKFQKDIDKTSKIKMPKNGTLLKHSCQAQKGAFNTLNNNESSFSFNELNENGFHAKKNSMAVTTSTFITAKSFKKRKISVPVCAQSNFLRTAPQTAQQYFVQTMPTTRTAHFNNIHENKLGASEVYGNKSILNVSNECSSKRDQSPLTPSKFLEMKQRVQNSNDDRSSSFNIYRDNFTKNSKMNMRQIQSKETANHSSIINQQRNLSLGDTNVNQFYKTQGAAGFADYTRPGKKFVQSRRAKLPSISYSRKSSNNQNRDILAPQKFVIGSPRDAVHEYLLMLEQPTHSNKQTISKFRKSK